MVGTRGPVGIQGLRANTVWDDVVRLMFWLGAGVVELAVLERGFDRLTHINTA